MPQLSLVSLVGGQFRTDLKCSACDLAASPELATNCMSGAGNVRNPTYFIVGHAPGKDDDRYGRPMTGRNGVLLRELLQESGIAEEECFFSNTLRCCTYETTLKERQWNACKDYLVKEILALNPQVIIASGAKAMTWLTGYTGLKKLRRQGLPCLLPVGDRLVFPIQQPAALFHVDGSYGKSSQQEALELRNEMVKDLRWIKQQLETGQLSRAGDILRDYQTARTPDDVDRFFAEFEQHDVLSADLETGDTEWNPRLFPTSQGRVVTAGFSFGPGIGRAIPVYAKGQTTYLFWPDDYYPKLVQRIADLFRNKTVFGHNFPSFDQKWVRRFFGVEYCKLDFDTMLAHYILDEEKGTHGLERLAVLYTTMPPWKSSFNLADTEKLCWYNCQDVDATWRLRQIFEPELNNRQQWLLKELLLPLSSVLMDMEYRGVTVSREGFDKLNAALTEKLRAVTTRIRSYPAVKAWETQHNEDFNPNAPPQIAEVMENYLRLKCVKQTKGKKYSTDREVLEYYSDQPFVADVEVYRRLSKLKGTYHDGLLEAIGEDGKLHTSYKLHGTVTGRPSSADPNLLNITKNATVEKVLDDGTLVKGLFAAEEGCCLLEADYSQIELRIMACLSGDPALQEIYRLDQDVHTATASRVSHVPIDEVTEQQRFKAKAVNFGIIYGQGIEGMVKRFIAEGSTEQDALEFREAHQKTFPGVWRFMENQEKLIRTQKFQETPFGRRRRYTDVTNDAIRMAYNFPIQSVASDLTLLSLIRIDLALKSLEIPAKIVLTVYDSIVLNIPFPYFWRTASLVKQLMESLRFPWLTVPIKVDMKAGLDWGHLKSVNLCAKSLE